MKTFVPMTILLCSSFVATCCGQSASVNVKADSGLLQDKRPFGKYLVEVCTLSGDVKDDGKRYRLLKCTQPAVTNSTHVSKDKKPVSKDKPAATDPKKVSDSAKTTGRDKPADTTPKSASDDKKTPATDKQAATDPNKVSDSTKTPATDKPSDKAKKTLSADQNDTARIAAVGAGQSLTLQVVCPPNSADSCEPPKPPLPVGSTFYVRAKSDSGQGVQQRLMTENAATTGGSDVVGYRVTQPGTIIIRAYQSVEQKPFIPGSPVDLVLQATNPPVKAPTTCPLLPATETSNTSAPLDASAIANLLGNPTPFIVSAQGPNALAIYSTRPYGSGSSTVERETLTALKNSIAQIAGNTSASLGVQQQGKDFSMVLTVPHASALGDLTARISSLNNSDFTAQNVGTDQVKITAKAKPECDAWKSFLNDVRSMAWRLVSEPMNKKLFYLSSSDVVTGFGSLIPAATPASGGGSGTPSSTPASSSSSPSPTASISIAQPAGSSIQITSDTTPCVVAGLAMGSNNPCSPPASPASSSTSSSGSGASGSSASAATGGQKSSLNMSSVAVAMGTAQQTPPDLLVFSDTTPGDDAVVQERTRVIAQLDLPRPEVLISAWVTQDSSSNPKTIGAFTNLVKDMVQDYNRQFEDVILRGWESVKQQSADGDYFEEAFRSYIEDRFVSDNVMDKPAASPQEASQFFLNGGQIRLAPPIVDSNEMNSPHICAGLRYCLGYTGLFHPLKPALTDLLLTIIAAKDPRKVTELAVAAVESGKDPTFKESEAMAFITSQTNVLSNTENGLCDHGSAERRDRCHAIWNNLNLDQSTAMHSSRSCVERDYRGIMDALFNTATDSEPRVFLQCFKEEAQKWFKPSSAQKPNGAGLLRAAVADFLYNYKVSQQYPHEFVPYDLTHSADALNSALTPMMDAFNRDLTTYQLFMRADMQYQAERLNTKLDGRCCAKRLFGLDKPSFFNDGLVTVRTISGQPTSVNTTTQSMLNVSTTPQLTALLNSFTQGGNSPAGANSVASGVLDRAPITAIANLLANYQTTSAQIGRALNLKVTPRSLSTASSAEIDVNLQADEAAPPAYFNTSGSASDPALNFSRIGNHDTTTRVRVDSVKLFEISSLTAILERSRGKFPLLPPFVEIPYVGSLAGIPLGSAREFHSSTAVLSAFVVPTAADIAYGLRFSSDLVVDPLTPKTDASDQCSYYRDSSGSEVKNICLFRKALSTHDYGRRDITSFNRAMIGCLAMGKPSDQCKGLTFDDIPATNR